MSWLLIAAALAAPSIDAPLRTGAKAPNDAAVVIGIEDYAFLPNVPYAERDAQAVEDLFVYTLGVPYDRVQRLGDNASREQILSAVDNAADLVGPDGTLWLYYAGHGAASASSGERILLGVDTMANAQSFEARAVPVSALKEAASDVHRTVLMVDACYAGASRGGQELLAGKRFAVPAYVKPTSAGWVEWNAAQPDELSGPLESAGHGAFTFAAVGALRGWADGQLSGVPDGTITLEEAQLFVAQTLRTVDVRDQKPDLAASDLLASLAAVPIDKLEAPPSVAALQALAEGAAPTPPPQPASQPLPKPQAAPVVFAAPPPDPNQERFSALKARVGKLTYGQDFDTMRALSVDVGRFMTDPETEDLHDAMRTFAANKKVWFDPALFEPEQLVATDRLSGAYRGGKSGSGNTVGGALLLGVGAYFIASVPVAKLFINDTSDPVIADMQTGFTIGGAALALPGAIMVPLGISRSAKTKKEVRARYGLDGSQPAWAQPPSGTADTPGDPR